MGKQRNAIPYAQIRWLMGNRHVATSDSDIEKEMAEKTAQWPERFSRRAIRYALACMRSHRKRCAEYGF